MNKLTKRIGALKLVKDKFFYISLVLLVVCVLAIATQGFNYNFFVKPGNASQVKQGMKFIDDNFLKGATTTMTSAINSVSVKDGMYYVKFSVNSSDGTKQDAEAYFNLKGNLLFPSAIDMKNMVTQAPAAQAQPTQAPPTQAPPTE